MVAHNLSYFRISFIIRWLSSSFSVLVTKIFDIRCLHKKKSRDFRSGDRVHQLGWIIQIKSRNLLVLVISNFVGWQKLLNTATRGQFPPVNLPLDPPLSCVKANSVQGGYDITKLLDIIQSFEEASQEAGLTIGRKKIEIISRSFLWILFSDYTINLASIRRIKNMDL